MAAAVSQDPAKAKICDPAAVSHYVSGVIDVIIPPKVGGMAEIFPYSQA